MERPRIIIIGSGNVATHLSLALDSAGDVVQVYSRNISNAKNLASRLSHALYTDDITNIDRDADYYIISVKDDAISEISAQMPQVAGIVMHTSGSVGIEGINAKHERKGVFYPLQTFSKDVAVDVSEVPFFIEASDAVTLKAIEALASAISKNVYHADSAQRATLHIAAVFGCNFVNHLLDISSQILAESGYTIDVLKPLLQVTIDKAMAVGPHAAQTGPAVRRDMTIISKHTDMLPPDKSAIYQMLSQHIMNNY